MATLGVTLSDADPECEHTIEPGVGQVHAAVVVESVHDRLSNFVASLVAHADQIEASRHDQFKVGVFVDVGRKLSGQFYVSSYVELKTFDSVVTDDKPKF